ncbi:hypothetical protein BY458DRAFT_544495 [Sporodiniella umbellata]|nr:hypothetical protein BY458DRAFT_544495 [Sporodiniella umbellata]
MERFKEKLNRLRAEAEQANATSDEYIVLIKQYENEGIQKEHEMTSLRAKTENLERRLQKTQNELRLTTLRYEEAESKADALERQLGELEYGLEDAEKRNDELKELTRFIKEEMEEYERQLEGY